MTSNTIPPYDSLWEALTHAARALKTRGVFLWGAHGARDYRTWAQVHESAARLGSALALRGVGMGDRVVVAMPTGFEFIISFFAALSIGAVPIPVSVHPRSLKALPGQLEFWHQFARSLDARTILYSADLPAAHRPTSGPTSPYENAWRFDHLLESVPIGASPDPHVAPTLCYIQPSAGAVGSPRPIELGHHNILTNLSAIAAALEVEPGEVGVSWLPLDNIMGLLGFVCLPMLQGMDTVLLSPDRFLHHPQEWFFALTQHRATFTAAPSFAYHYALRRTSQIDLEDVDLSTLRVALNGGAPVRPEYMRQFQARLEPTGLRGGVFVPVYGLTEGTLGVTFARAGGGSELVDVIDRQGLERAGVATPAPQGATVVSLGTPLRGVEVRVLLPDGEVAAERQVGEIAFRGPNAMLGYALESAKQTPGAVRGQGGWLCTGDLGYMVEGRLFLWSRSWDLVRLDSGRRIAPHEVEWCVDDIDGVRAGSSVCFQAEGAVVVGYEVQAGADSNELAGLVRASLSQHLSLTPDVVMALTPFSVPRTRDGKTRRLAARELYLQGRLDQRERARELEGIARLWTRARGDVLRATSAIRDRVSGWLRRS